VRTGIHGYERRRTRPGDGRLGARGGAVRRRTVRTEASDQRQRRRLPGPESDADRERPVEPTDSGSERPERPCAGYSVVGSRRPPAGYKPPVPRSGECRVPCHGPGCAGTVYKSRAGTECYIHV
jgi:hypothetical protein